MTQLFGFALSGRTCLMYCNYIALSNKAVQCHGLEAAAGLREGGTKPQHLQIVLFTFFYTKFSKSSLVDRGVGD